MTSSRTITVALIGNPNTGKSTLFNALSGLRQRTGNYPGVTVELSKGRCTIGETTVELLDLPGTYSLAPRSPDEMISVDLLLGRRKEESPPDVIVSVVDASNLERHLYLTTQLMNLGKPVIVAVNMIDVAAGQGIAIDTDRLSRESGLTVVPIQANSGLGLDRLKQAILNATTNPPNSSGPAFPPAFGREVDGLATIVNGSVPRFLVERLLLDVGGSTESLLIDQYGTPLKSKLENARLRLAEAGHAVPAVEAKARYSWIRQILKPSVTQPKVRPASRTDRIDRVLTHKVWGTLVFLALMFVVFQSIFVAAVPLMDAIKDLQTALAAGVTGLLPAGPFRSLLVDGVIQGVGSVIVFLPQILILFGFIAILEDCGYMARAAFLMDKVMSRCGLSGKSFIPLLSSVACAVPGIMATRVIENRRDRFATILIAPLMSCSARLPVYSLLIGAFLTAGYPFWVPGVTLFGMYLIGFAVAPVVALLLRRTVLHGETPVFVMELPMYRRPQIRMVLRRMLGAAAAFLKRAGTVILATMILIWAVSYFPSTRADGTSYEAALAALKEKEDENKTEIGKLEAEWKQRSYLGRVGTAIEPVVRPLGWDAKLGTATLASFPAREVIVGTLGILYEQGAVEDDEGQKGLGEAIRAEWKDDPILGRYGVPVALSVMVFFALCCQCASTLAVIWRETRSWKWPAFCFIYMTVLAYVGAWLTFQIGRLIVG